MINQCWECSLNKSYVTANLLRLLFTILCADKTFLVHIYLQILTIAFPLSYVFSLCFNVLHSKQMKQTWPVSGLNCSKTSHVDAAVYNLGHLYKRGRQRVPHMCLDGRSQSFTASELTIIGSTSHRWSVLVAMSAEGNNFLSYPLHFLLIQISKKHKDPLDAILQLSLYYSL